MKVTGTEQLIKFKDRYADVRSQVDAWLAEAKGAEWRTPQDIKIRYGNCKFIHDNQVIFHLRANHYRLVVKVSYKVQVVKIVWVGTHEEYDSVKF